MVEKLDEFKAYTQYELVEKINELIDGFEKLKEHLHINLEVL